MKFPIRVYYEDTDAGGVVYHSRYLHFFERARTEFLRQKGFSQQQLLAERLAFVVKHMEIDYRVPAKLDDFLVVESTIIELKGAKIVFEQRLLRESECLCEAKVVVASVNLEKMRVVALPKVISQALQAG